MFFPINFGVLSTKIPVGGQLLIEFHSGILYMVLKSCFGANINKYKCTVCKN